MKNCPVCNAPWTMPVATAGTIVKCTNCGTALREASESADQSPPPLSKTQPARVSLPSGIPPPPSRNQVAKPRRPGRRIAKTKTSNLFLLTAFCSVAGFCFLLLVISRLNNRSRLPRNERQVTNRQTSSTDGSTPPATTTPVSPAPNTNNSKPAPASTNNGSAPTESTGSRVYKKTLKSVVFILHQQGTSFYTGSGFVIDRSQRLVATAFHVVENQSEVWVAFPAFKRDKSVITDRSYYFGSNAKLIRGKVVVKQKNKDLALLQLDTMPSTTEPVSLATERVEPGQEVYTVGNPGKSEGMWVFSSGAVRQVFDQHQFVLEGNQVVVADIIETQNPTRRGDSGGPLLNAQGDLVGVNSGGLFDGSLFSYFIDASEVKRLLARFRP